MNQGKSKGVSNYEIIDSGICPKCRGKMRSSDHTENNGFNWYCDHCQLLYKFHDDPGPGAYSTINLKPRPRVAEEPMKPSDEEKKEFKPQEGDRILASADLSLFASRIFLYMDRHGRCACVHSDDEEIYNGGSLRFRIVIWPCAKPLPPKLPEFIQGDPVIVGVDDKSTERIRVVHSVTEDGIKCFWDGLLNSWVTPILHHHYKPLPNYNYGRRNVFEV